MKYLKNCGNLSLYFTSISLKKSLIFSIGKNTNNLIFAKRSLAIFFSFELLDFNCLRCFVIFDIKWKKHGTIVIFLNIYFNDFSSAFEKSILIIWGFHWYLFFKYSYTVIKVYLFSLAINVILHNIDLNSFELNANNIKILYLHGFGGRA